MSTPPPFTAAALTFDPWLEERVWGGRGLERFGKMLPPGRPIGESWEVSDLEGKSSTVARGPHRGVSLRDLLRSHGAAVLGEAPRGPGSRLPLIKLLDARADLSVQVHPSGADLAAAGVAGGVGKTETWVILEAEPGARVVLGIPGDVGRDAFYDRMSALGGGPLPRREEETLLRWEPVAAGDVIHVPAGTIHSVGRGILLLEVQEPSDITYRIYDWGRRQAAAERPRELHLAEARAVAVAPPVPCPFTRIEEAARPGRFAPLVVCEFYRLELLRLASGVAGAGEVRASTRGDGPAGYHVLVGLEGQATYATAAGDRLEIRPGTFALVPAVLGEYTLATASEQATVLRIRGPENVAGDRSRGP
jgi:mannose-6-phosphate isomerase